FDDAQVYGWMETKSALVRSDGAVKLYAITTVYLNFTVIVNPWDTEHNNAFWFDDTFQKRCVLVFWFIVYNQFQGIHNFCNSLDKFRFIWIFLDNIFNDAVSIRHKFFPP